MRERSKRYKPISKLNMKQELWKRVRSFGWRLGGMALVAGLAFISSNLELFNLSPALIGLAGLLIGEATKWINSHFAIEDKVVGAVKRLSGR